MKLIWLVLFLILASCGGGNGQPPVPCSATLTWDAPTTRLDGTPLELTELKKYTIFMASQPDTEDTHIERVVDLNNINFITWEIRNIEPGDYWFYMTVTDTEDLISPFSNILGKTC